MCNTFNRGIPFYYQLIVLLGVCGSDISCRISSNDLYENESEDMTGYGVTWMYFPDGDDIPRRISLEENPMQKLRWSIESDDIEYRLFTRNNLNEPILLDGTATPISPPEIDVSKRLSGSPIKIVTHGWESSADKSAVVNIMQAYLKAEEVCVIAVDWSRVSESVMYPVVAYQTKTIGGLVGKFLDALNERYNVTGNQIHLIGHSLGAHVMGNAGSNTKLKIGRVTGLDPARPMFEIPSTDNASKLDTSDAEFVDVIHTCGGVLGVESPSGHADFFPNNGAAPQPGCSSIQRIMEACSHSRSHYYFAESILYPRAFPACSNWTEYLQNNCSNQALMGNPAKKDATGIFYLSTNPETPYGRSL